MADAPRRLRVLLTDGSSTSAREAIICLGLAGHHVEVCDPNPFCFARFSRFTRKIHLCPGLRDDPLGFLAFVVALLDREPFDVLLPIHEQGYVLSLARDDIAARVGVALPEFASYRTAHGKASFSRLLDQLDLPQPGTDIVGNAGDLRAAARYPCVIKTAVGTASRGVWHVRDATALDLAISAIAASDGFANEVLVQDHVEGALEKAQAVFHCGELLGFHGYRQIAAGAGGGDAIKRSAIRPDVRYDLAAIGRALDWHGALSIDYIVAQDDAPRYIDCNPRLVEPMSARLAGIDLVYLLLEVSMGERPQPRPDGRADVRTHQAMQVLLGGALQGATRRDLLKLCVDLATGRSDFAGSTEELTPVRDDGPSAVPLAITAMLLLASPRLAGPLAARGWGAHLLTQRSIALIDAADAAKSRA